ncbi:hypothetical protein AJ80_08436 [Polytolypa hystricis UAMH7299]|uniref:NB-ARC domain-containing protein n=1 Tax=Polytolypa hystricis (strain UAMH7299) TaxID=1447883 RepID=A0A2B7X846_POLH7|nr:hypothetical protein AJ80_08436 [Polytolypa hystricis UAMH7299]
MRLKPNNSIVEATAKSTRMRVDTLAEHSPEMSPMKGFETSIPKGGILPCYYIPFTLNKRVIRRDNILEYLKDVLDPQPGNCRNRSLALHGMGGVGKSAIGRQYVNSSRDKCDAIFWISADKRTNMIQCFIDIAQKLGFISTDRRSEDADAAIIKVKDWLNVTDCRWLVIFDNADDLELLTHFWPGSAPGSILLTSKDTSAAFSPARAGVFVEPFDDETGAAVFLELLGQDNPSSNRDIPEKITFKLGGLPHALC